MKLLRSFVLVLIATIGGFAQTPATSYQVSHTYVVVGTYTATVSATDAAGNYNTAQAVETVNNFVGVGLPNVSLTLSPNPAFPGASIGNPPLTVTATVTTDAPCVTTVAVNWGDGTTSIGSPSAHVYTVGGLYTVQASVTDCLSNTGTTLSTFLIGSAAHINSIQLILPNVLPNQATDVYTPIRVYAVMTAATAVTSVTITVDNVLVYTAPAPNAVAGTVYILDHYLTEAVGTQHTITVQGTMADGTTVTSTAQVNVTGVIN